MQLLLEEENDEVEEDIDVKHGFIVHDLVVRLVYGIVPVGHAV